MPTVAKGTLQWYLQKVRLDPDTHCWLWTGSVNSAGYGPHARVCELSGHICPDNAEHHHTCANKLCVNPLHITFLSRSANQAHAKAKASGRRGWKELRMARWLHRRVGR